MRTNDDPLARMRVSTAGYAGLTKSLCDAADRHCHGRVVAVTEGGYDLTALKGCLESTLAVLDGAQSVPQSSSRDPASRWPSRRCGRRRYEVSPQSSVVVGSSVW